jgi:hypothetical protein
MTQDQRNGFIKLVATVRDEYASRKYPYGWNDKREAEAKEEIQRELALQKAEAAQQKAEEEFEKLRSIVWRIEHDTKERMRQLEREWSEEKVKDLSVFTLATSNILALDDADKANEVVHQLSNL